MATEGDRTLSSGISIPQWMKSKVDSRLVFDDNAFSPPESDDTFLYIRYPRLIETENSLKTEVKTHTVVASSAADSIQHKFDFTNHTAPCRKYITNQPTIKLVKSSPDVKVKSNGTDDGFKGEAAQCGSSVVRVAHQMVLGKLHHSPSEVSAEEYAVTPKGFDPARRRGSKSLPSSPLSSPKSKRRVANKYFTGAFADNEDNRGGWLLTSLLGKRDVSLSIGNIDEETKEDLPRVLSEIKLDENLGLEQKKQKTVYKAKASQFREMNFLSPTSM